MVVKVLAVHALWRKTTVSSDTCGSRCYHVGRASIGETLHCKWSYVALVNEHIQKQKNKHRDNRR